MVSLLPARRVPNLYPGVIDRLSLSSVNLCHEGRHAYGRTGWKSNCAGSSDRGAIIAAVPGPAKNWVSELASRLADIIRVDRPSDPIVIGFQQGLENGRDISGPAIHYCWISGISDGVITAKHTFEERQSDLGGLIDKLRVADLLSRVVVVESRGSGKSIFDHLRGQREKDPRMCALPHFRAAGIAVACRGRMHDEPHFQNQ
jgi:hypothetical protein